jgi:hypothetical protein
MLRRGMNQRHPGSFRKFIAIVNSNDSFPVHADIVQIAGAVVEAIRGIIGVSAENPFRTTLKTLPEARHAGRLARSSKSLLPALIEGDLSVRKSRRLPRQLDDRFSLFAAIGERHQKKAFIAFLQNLDLGWGLRH